MHIKICSKPRIARLLQVAGVLCMLHPLSGMAQKINATAPIKIGAVSTLSGAGAFKESTDAAKAYFDRINQEGGIHGRKIDYLPLDDKANPDEARHAAQKLVEVENVVAMAGGTSLADCASNAHYYEQANLMSVVGGAIQPECFNAANLSPVNAGPYLGLANALTFASDVRQRQKVCAVMLDLPGVIDGYKKIIAIWSSQYGKNLTLADYTYQLSSTPDQFLDKTIKAGCQAVVFTGNEALAIDWLKAVRARKIEGVDWIFLTPAYSQSVADQFSTDATLDIFAMSEFEPWSSRSSTLNEWSSLIRDAKLSRTSLSQAGYLSAYVVVNVLKGIHGDINRKSVSAALKSMAPMNTQITGSPYVFGSASRHASNRAVLPMKLIGKSWRIAHHTWIIFPENSAY